MKSLTAFHAASIVPVWQLIFSIPRTSDPCVDLPALRTNVCKDATLPDICAAEQHVAEEVQGR